MAAVLTDGLAKNAEGEGAQKIIAGAQGNTGKKLGDIGYRDQAGIGFQGVVQADVFAAAEVIPKGMFVEIDRSMIVDLQETGQSATVVIVTVGEDAQVYLGQINAQPDGIVGKGAGLTGIKEDIVFSCFDVQTQAMFGSQVFPERGVFNQDSYFHGYILKSEFRCSDPLRAE